MCSGKHSPLHIQILHSATLQGPSGLQYSLLDLLQEDSKQCGITQSLRAFLQEHFPGQISFRPILYVHIFFTYHRFKGRLDDQPRPFPLPLPPPHLPIPLSLLLPLPPQLAPLCDWSNLPCSIPVFTSVTTL